MNTETLSVDIQPKIHIILSDVTQARSQKRWLLHASFSNLVCVFAAVVLGRAGFDSILNNDTVTLPRLLTSLFYRSVTDCNRLFISHSDVIQNINNKSERTQLLKSISTDHALQNLAGNHERTCFITAS